MQNYIDLLRYVRENGVFKGDRTGTGCYSSFAHMLKWDLRDGLPVVTTKEVHLKSVIHELLWFLSGSDNIGYLQENGVKIWDGWALKEDVLVKCPRPVSSVIADYADAIGSTFAEAQRALNAAASSSENRSESKAVGKDFDLLREAGVKWECLEVTRKAGDVGPMYGTQWRKGFAGIDQIKEVERQLRERPNSRRIRVTAWNPSDLPDEGVSPQENVKQGRAALASCHCDFQLVTENIPEEERAKLVVEEGNVVPEYYLNLHFTMRSWDLFLGGPFNIASYAILQKMFARSAIMIAKELAVTGVDVHLYSNHLEQVDLQLTREPRQMPLLDLRKPVGTSVLDYVYEDIVVLDYNPHPAIKAPISI